MVDPGQHILFLITKKLLPPFQILRDPSQLLVSSKKPLYNQIGGNNMNIKTNVRAGSWPGGVGDFRTKG